MMKVFLPIFVFIFSFKAFSQAGVRNWICDTIFKSSNYGCDNPVKSNSTGGSYPLLNDAFNVNPSSLPVNLTPVGVEMFMDGGKTNFSLIKGTGKAGFGVASQSTSGGFFSNASNVEVSQIASGQKPRSAYTGGSGTYSPNLNLGTAFNLIGGNGGQGGGGKFNIGRFLDSNFGLQTKYIEEVGGWRMGYGFNFKTWIFNGGFSVFKNPLLGDTRTASLGIRFWKFMGDVSYFENTAGDANRTLISSGTLLWGNFIATYGYRKQENNYVDASYVGYLEGQGVTYKSTHTMYGLSYRLKEKLTIGYYNGYLLGKGSSFLFQYFF